ncbi:hypothetical protein JCM10450v2_000305 [Rhodotorula kratochvilovae]
MEYASDNDDDDEILVHTPPSVQPFRRGHHPRPSAAALLDESPSTDLGFALINMCVKLLERDVKVPVWELIAIRMSMTWVGCYTYLRLSGDPHPFAGPPGVRLLLALRGFVGFFGLYSNYAALQYLSLADTSTLFFLSPILVGILGFLILREPYSRIEALVGLASLSGTVFIAKPTFLFPAAETTEDMPGHVVTSEQRTFAICLVLGGCFTSSCVSIIIRYIGNRASPLHSISYFCIYSVIVSSMYPLVFDAPPVFSLSGRFFALLLPIGVLGFCAQTLTTRGLVLEKAGRGALATYTGLLFTLIIERLAFHKSPDGWSLLGAAIIIGGAIRVALEHKGAPVVAPVTAGGSGAAEGTEMARAGRGRDGYDPLVSAEEGRERKSDDEEGFSALGRRAENGEAARGGRGRGKARGEAATTGAVPARA